MRIVQWRRERRELEKSSADAFYSRPLPAMTLFRFRTRAFAVDPEILLCDEPFSSLDEMTARDLRGEFVRLVRQNGKTAVFITHHINEALEIGDRILVFHRPARIAYEARLGEAATDSERRHVQERILEILALERSIDAPQS